MVIKELDCKVPIESELDEAFNKLRKEALLNEDNLGQETRGIEKYSEKFSETVKKLFVNSQRTFGKEEWGYETMQTVATYLHDTKTTEEYFKLSIDDQKYMKRFIFMNDGLFHTLIHLMDLCGSKTPIIGIGSDRHTTPIYLYTNYGDTEAKYDHEYRPHYNSLYPRYSAGGIVNDLGWELLSIILTLMTLEFGKKKVLEILEKREREGIDFSLPTLFQFLKEWDTNEDLKVYPTDWIIESGMLKDKSFVSYRKTPNRTS